MEKDKKKSKKSSNNVLGEKIKKARICAGYSQSALAEKINVSRSAIAGYENSNITPSLEVLQKLSETLNVDLIPSIIGCTELVDVKVELDNLIGKLSGADVYYDNVELNYKDTFAIIDLLRSFNDILSRMVEHPKK